MFGPGVMRRISTAPRKSRKVSGAISRALHPDGSHAASRPSSCPSPDGRRDAVARTFKPKSDRDRALHDGDAVAGDLHTVTFEFQPELAAALRNLVRVEVVLAQNTRPE